MSEIHNGKTGRLFNGSYMEFYDVLKAQGFDLPKGHSTIMQTRTYAHLAPDYLNEAITLNPMSTL